MKLIRPNVQKPQKRKATPEQRTIRRWFLGLSRDRACELIRESHSYAADFVGGFFRQKWIEDGSPT